MPKTHFQTVFRESIGNIWREIKISFTPIPHPQKWVFIVGCYNSGTTLLSELLGKHPDISSLPTEGHFITNQFVKDYDVGLPRMWAVREEFFRLTEDDTGPDPIRIKKEWGMRFNLSKPVLLEKSPPNCVRTRWLNKYFNPAYFIAIVRNGYAVSEGISRKADPKHLRDGWQIDQCAWQWKRSIEVLEEDSPFLQNIIWVKYEDIVDNTLSELNRIISFLKLKPFENFNKDINYSIHERNEPLKNMNPNNISRLNHSQIASINKIAKNTLLRYGYSLLSE